MGGGSSRGRGRRTIKIIIIITIKIIIIITIIGTLRYTCTGGGASVLSRMRRAKGEQII